MLPQQVVHVPPEREDILKCHAPPLHSVPLCTRPCVRGQPQPHALDAPVRRVQRRHIGGQRVEPVGGVQDAYLERALYALRQREPQPHDLRVTVRLGIGLAVPLRPVVPQPRAHRCALFLRHLQGHNASADQRPASQVMTVRRHRRTAFGADKVWQVPSVIRVDIEAQVVAIGAVVVGRQRVYRRRTQQVRQQ